MRSAQPHQHICSLQKASTHPHTTPWEGQGSKSFVTMAGAFVRHNCWQTPWHPRHLQGTLSTGDLLLSCVPLPTSLLASLAPQRSLRRAPAGPTPGNKDLRGSSKGLWAKPGHGEERKKAGEWGQTAITEDTRQVKGRGTFRYNRRGTESESTRKAKRELTHGEGKAEGSDRSLQMPPPASQGRFVTVQGLPGIYRSSGSLFGNTRLVPSCFFLLTCQPQQALLTPEARLTPPPSDLTAASGPFQPHPQLQGRHRSHPASNKHEENREPLSQALDRVPGKAAISTKAGTASQLMLRRG